MKTEHIETQQNQKNQCNNDNFIGKPTPGNHDSTIELEPFIHQVGGRSTILVLGKYICKPINDRELNFYETINQYAPRLKPFVAQFHGTISVNFEETSDGYLVITTKSRVQNRSETSKLIDDDHPIDNDELSIESSDSPYQKFVTKYRIKLVRPIKEIIIESHESEDIGQHIDLESHNLEKIKRYILNDRENKLDQQNNHQHSSQNVTTNLNRSRSTSISIPNFEDGNCNQSDLTSLFDNQLFTNEVGGMGGNSQNGFKENSSKERKISSPERIHCRTGATSPTSPKLLQYTLSTTKHNPWVLKTFSVLSEFNESMKEQKFILLENLTSNFEYPCIMDLKMGTRLHDDMATQTKIQSHESKVNETTSGALGLRVTGIQIYDKNLDKFICYNKYYGRKLTPETFRTTLKMFVSNENFRRHQLLERLIERLQQLRSVILDLDGFRFYTSSLLLIYEGNTCQCDPSKITTENCASNDQCELCNQDPEKLFDVRVIDFAHSTHSNMNRSQSSIISIHQSYDEGFLFGLDNLIKILTLFHQE